MDLEHLPCLEVLNPHCQLKQLPHLQSELYLTGLDPSLGHHPLHLLSESTPQTSCAHPGIVTDELEEEAHEEEIWNI